MSDELDDRCHYCAKRIKYTATSKRRRTYCDESCKQAAHRWRKKLGTNAESEEAALTKWRRLWITKEYSDQLSEALSNLWRDVGEEVFRTKILPVLLMQEQWAIQHYLAKFMDKRNEV